VPGLTSDISEEL